MCWFRCASVQEEVGACSGCWIVGSRIGSGVIAVSAGAAPNSGELGAG